MHSLQHHHARTLPAPGAENMPDPMQTANAKSHAAIGVDGHAINAKSHAINFKNHATNAVGPAGVNGSIALGSMRPAHQPLAPVGAARAVMNQAVSSDRALHNNNGTAAKRTTLVYRDDDLGSDRAVSTDDGQDARADATDDFRQIQTAVLRPVHDFAVPDAAAPRASSRRDRDSVSSSAGPVRQEHLENLVLEDDDRYDTPSSGSSAISVSSDFFRVDPIYDKPDFVYVDVPKMTEHFVFLNKLAVSVGQGPYSFPPIATDRDLEELEAAAGHTNRSFLPREVADELCDPSMAAEYSEDIWKYMRELETTMLPDADYMTSQSEISWPYRTALLEWLVGVGMRFSLLPETMFLAVNYIDRFLSCKAIGGQRIQLVGVTAIQLACKYEEISCPALSEVLYLAEGSIPPEEMLRAERYMLSTLEWKLGYPGPMTFLRRISKADEYEVESRSLAKYFLDVAMMEPRFVTCQPSYVAAAAYCLARFMVRKACWTPEHVYLSGYTYAHLRPAAQILLECCRMGPIHHRAIFDKYSAPRAPRHASFVQMELRTFILPRTQPAVGYFAPDGCSFLYQPGNYLVSDSIGCYRLQG